MRENRDSSVADVGASAVLFAPEEDASRQVCDEPAKEDDPKAGEQARRDRRERSYPTTYSPTSAPSMHRKSCVSSTTYESPDLTADEKRIAAPWNEGRTAHR